jgi:hypothetical protein
MNLFSDKYNKVYRDGSHLKKALPFHFFLQVISFAFFIFIKLFLDASKTDWILYIQILLFYFLYFI